MRTIPDSPKLARADLVPPVALLYYDYVLTFPMEVRYIWKADKLKVSTGLYVLYRYALLANVLYLLAIAKKLGSKVCTVQHAELYTS